MPTGSWKRCEDLGCTKKATRSDPNLYPLDRVVGVVDRAARWCGLHQPPLAHPEPPSTSSFEEEVEATVKRTMATQLAQLQHDLEKGHGLERAVARMVVRLNQ